VASATNQQVGTSSGMLDSARSYLDTRAVSQFQNGYSLAGCIDVCGIIAIDYLLPHSGYEVPLMFMGGVGKVGKGVKAFAPGKWLWHFEKHGVEFGYRNSVEYLKGAQRLTKGGEGILSHTRANGDRLFYSLTKNEFGVLSRNGQTIRTYFKPKEGYSYWLDKTGGH